MKTLALLMAFSLSAVGLANGETPKKKDADKVKDLIKLLQQENQELTVVFWNELMDDNHWGCNISLDDVNKVELCIEPTMYDES